jgi:hypothetical protein
MVRLPVIILIIPFAFLSVQAADITDYETIGISSPLITQIYTNPELSQNEDLELAPDTQIMLYENFSDELCKTLKEEFKNKIEFTCLGDIRGELDTDEWNDFNRLFTGQNSIDKDTARAFGKKLGVDAMLDSYLMFSYYKNDNSERHLEVHFEWYLIDLTSGESRVDGKYDCDDDFDGETEAAQKEADCFKGIIKSMEELGR